MRKILWVLLLASCAAQTPQTGAMLGLNQTFTGINIFSGPVVFTSTMSGSTLALSNPGVFTGAQMNPVVQSLLNGCSPATEFHSGFGASLNTTAAGTFCVSVPSASTVFQANGVEAYVNNAAGTATGSVAVFGNARVLSVNARIWGGNFVANGLAGNASINLYGTESDCNVANTGDQCHGLLLAGGWTAQPTVSDAITIATPNSAGGCVNCTWPYGIRFAQGATTTPAAASAAIAFYPIFSGVGQVSQGFVFLSNDPSAGQNAIAENESAAGDLQITYTKLGHGLINSGTISAADPLFGSSQTGGPSACETTFGITTLSGASTSTGLSCLPANSIIDAVVYRITTTITTAVSFTVGDSGSATRYCGTQSVMTAGTTGICLAAGYYLNTGALSVKITPNTTPGAGAIRLIVYYHTWTAPTS